MRKFVRKEKKLRKRSLNGSFFFLPEVIFMTEAEKNRLILNIKEDLLSLFWEYGINYKKQIVRDKAENMAVDIFNMIMFEKEEKR